jgi:hypothetical protein
MNIWQFQTRLSRRLQNWAIFSVASGLLMRFGGRYWRGMGGQFIGWGLINAAIALFGRSAADNRAADYENPGAPQVLAKESRNLRRLLLINAGLDVLYILFGAGLAARDKGDGTRKGNGRGIIIQGAFLFVFDVLHAAMLPRHED